MKVFKFFSGALLFPGLAFAQATINGAANQQIVMGPQSAQQQSSLTYYVDSFAGNDASAGTSPATAWKTIAKVNATSIPSGAQVLFNSEGRWSEQLNTSSGVRYSWYGTPRQCTLSALLVPTCTHMPIIDGSDVIAGPWSASGAAYARAYTTVASKVYVDALYQQTNSLTLTSWQGTYSSANGTIYIPGQGVTLSSVSYVALQTNGKDGGGNAQGAGSVTPGTNSAVWLPITGNPTTALGMVQALPGYFLADGTNLTVHLLDNTTPAGHVIEAAGSRSYGINLAGTSNVTIDGIEVIRTAKSGIVMYNAGNPTGANNVIRNNVAFNCSDQIGDTAIGGAIGGCIAAFGGFAQSPEPSVTVDGNWVGQMDTPHALNSYLLSGILVAGTLNSNIINNKIATVNGWSTTCSDYYGAPSAGCYVANNESVNSEGNLHPVGSENAIYAYNNIHDSFGNGAQVGQSNVGDGTHTGNGVRFIENTIRHIRPAYGNGLYNGIDVNNATGMSFIGGSISDVASFGITWEADAAASSGMMSGVLIDSSNNVSFNNGVCGTGQRCGPFYIRDTSLTASIATYGANFLRGNRFIFNPLTPVMAMGGTGAGDTSKDLTEAQFDAAYPLARVNAVGAFVNQTISRVGAAVASASTIVPTGTIFHVTGTSPIATMTPPTGTSATAGTTLTLIADAAWSVTAGSTTGQFKAAFTAVAGTAYVCTFDGTLFYCK